MVERLGRVGFGRRRVCGSKGLVVCGERWVQMPDGGVHRSPAAKGDAGVYVEDDDQVRVPLETGSVPCGENG